MYPNSTKIVLMYLPMSNAPLNSKSTSVSIPRELMHASGKVSMLARVQTKLSKATPSSTNNKDLSNSNTIILDTILVLNFTQEQS